jgi:hypothetical protein
MVMRLEIRLRLQHGAEVLIGGTIVAGDISYNESVSPETLDSDAIKSVELSLADYPPHEISAVAWHRLVKANIGLFIHLASLSPERARKGIHLALSGEPYFRTILTRSIGTESCVVYTDSAATEAVTAEQVRSYIQWRPDYNPPPHPDLVRVSGSSLPISLTDILSGLLQEIPVVKSTPH